MSDELLVSLINNLATCGAKKVIIIWHGGEPLLAGIEFYKKALCEQKKYPDITFENRLQTNATLLNEGWVSFFKENGFGIGISLDGVRCVQNYQRPGVGSSQTFDVVIEKIKLMKEGGLRFGLIQTITSRSSRYVADSFELFYTKLGLRSWNVNFVDEESHCTDGETTEGLSISGKEMLGVYNHLIDLWLEKDDKTLKIDEIDQFVAAAIGRRTSYCHFCGTCGNFACIDFDGRVYPCDRFCANSQSSVGSLLRNSLLDIMQGDKMVHFKERAKRLHKDCTVCKWVTFCNNGCTAMRDKEGKFRHCLVRLGVFERMSKIISATRKKKGRDR